MARNALHIRGEDSVKFDVNEKACPNADLVIRVSYEGASDKVKASPDKSICSQVGLEE